MPVFVRFHTLAAACPFFRSSESIVSSGFAPDAQTLIEALRGRRPALALLLLRQVSQVKAAMSQLIPRVQKL